MVHHATRIYKGNNKWYFIILNGNGVAVACSTRSYTRREDCQRALLKMIRRFKSW